MRIARVLLPLGLSLTTACSLLFDLNELSADVGADAFDEAGTGPRTDAGDSGAAMADAPSDAGADVPDHSSADALGEAGCSDGQCSASVVLALDSGTITCLTADDNNVYYGVSTSSLWQASNVDGANPILLSSSLAPTQCTVASALVYALNYQAVTTVPIGGGGPNSPLNYAPEVIQSFAVAPSGAVWATTPMAYQVGCGSCAASGTADYTEIVTLDPSADPFGIALDPAGDTVFWTNRGDGTIASAPTSSPADAGIVTTLVTSQQAPNSIAADGTSLYWTTGDNRIMRASQDGGTVMTLASLAAGTAVDSISVDGDSVYFRAANLNALMRAPIQGGSPVTIAAPPGLLTAIAIPPGDYLYFGWGSPGTIQRVHK